MASGGRLHTAPGGARRGGLLPASAATRPSTPGSVRSTSSSVRQALATYSHASRVSGQTPQELLRRSDVATERRMKAGKNHTFKRARRDLLPTIPVGENAVMKKRTTRVQARQKMACVRGG